MGKLPRILIIGPAPQNIGGISIHIRRLMALLKGDYEFDIVDEGHKRWNGVFNLRSLNLFKYFGKIFRANIIHIQSGHFVLRLFHVIICKFIFLKNTVVTVHRDPNIEGRTSITRWFLKRCNSVIVVNDKGYDALVVKNCKCSYLLLPAYLPPDINAEHQLPDEIIQKIAEIRQDSNSFLMVSNAWKLVRHNNEDLYGLDQCIEALVELKKSENHYYLIFVIADNTDAAPYVNQYKKIIEENDIAERVMIWEKPLSFVRLAQASDIVLRTTNTDGDAISIREALDLNKIVIASDVVKRPQGVKLFKTRDVNSLVATIENSIGDRGSSQAEKIDYRQKYISIYSKNNK